MNHHISVAIPAFKTEFLSEAIQSVLNQTYPNWELVIVDDCSPNDIKSVVSSFSDSRIKYHRNEKNCGIENVVDNWNICLDYCTGDYIICMGDDDKLLPTCLDEYVSLVNKYPGLGVYHAWTEIINEKGKIIRFQESRPEYESVSSMIYFRMMYRRYQFIGDWMFDTNLLKEAGGFYKLPCAWGSDDISAERAASMGNKGVANTQVPCFQYRVNSLSISTSVNTELKLKAHGQHQEWLEAFLASHLSSLSKDDVEYELCRLAQEKTASLFSSLRQDEIMRELAERPSRVFYWLKKSNSIQLNKNRIVKALILGLWRCSSRE